MGHRTSRLALAAAALVAATTVIVGCGSSSSTRSASSTATSTVAPAAGSSSTPASGATTIDIDAFTFRPSSLTVAPGTTVTVHNSDQVAHTVTADGSSKGAFNTGDIKANATTTFRAPIKAGTYSYDCSIHLFMTGTLIVS